MLKALSNYIFFYQYLYLCKSYLPCEVVFLLCLDSENIVNVLLS